MGNRYERPTQQRSEKEICFFKNKLMVELINKSWGENKPVLGLNYNEFICDFIENLETVIYHN